MKEKESNRMYCAVHSDTMKHVHDLEILSDKEILQKVPKCNNDKNVAEQYCPICNKVYCLKCAFNHVSHGVQDFSSTIANWKNEIKQATTRSSNVEHSSMSKTQQWKMLSENQKVQQIFYYYLLK